jgi:hypothetical protein
MRDLRCLSSVVMIDRSTADSGYGPSHFLNNEVLIRCLSVVPLVGFGLRPCLCQQACKFPDEVHR